jgi:hypothetical protein
MQFARRLHFADSARSGSLVCAKPFSAFAAGHYFQTARPANLPAPPPQIHPKNLSKKSFCHVFAGRISGTLTFGFSMACSPFQFYERYP